MIVYIFLKYELGLFTLEDTNTENDGWWASIVQSIMVFIDWIFRHIYQFIMVTILSPVMAILAEKADNHLTGAKFDGGIVRMLKDFWRTVLIATTAFLVFIIIYIFWSLFAWMVGIDFISPVILFFVNAFFLGFAYMDYALERYQHKVGTSWEYAFKNWKTMIILGSIFSLIFYIPYAGALFAPYLVTLMATSIWIVRKKRKAGKSKV